MLPEYRSEFLYITAGYNKWRAGVDAGSENILESHAGGRAIYGPFEGSDEYFGASDNARGTVHVGVEERKLSVRLTERPLLQWPGRLRRPTPTPALAS